MRLYPASPMHPNPGSPPVVQDFAGYGRLAPAQGCRGSGPAPALVGAKPFRRPDEAILKHERSIRSFSSVTQVRKMMEAVTAILALVCAGIFLAHAVDAYLTP
jgi:hypothetical protein